MAAASARIDIVKFDGTNFQLWKLIVSIILKTERLLDVVVGSVPQPEDHNSNEWQVWQGKNSKAEVILLTTMSPD